MSSCKSIILRGLARTIRQAHFSSKLQILRWFGRFRTFSCRLSALALCKSIIPGHLLEGLRKSIIIGYLGLAGFRSGHSLDLARDLARSECFLRSIIAIGLSAEWLRTDTSGRPRKPKTPQTYLSRTYIYFTAKVKSRGRRRKEGEIGRLLLLARSSPFRVL